MADNSTHNDEDDNSSTAALLRFMKARGLNAGSLAKRAGFSASVIYNLDAGRSKSPSMAVLQRIAQAEGVSVADIMAYAKTPDDVPISHMVIAGGRVVAGNSTVRVARPQTIDPSLEVDACEIAGDGLHPIPGSWIVWFASKPQAAGDLLDQLCVVRLRGQTDAVIATIREGRTSDVVDLEPWHGAAQRSVTVIAAHKVVAITPPQIG